MKKKKLHGGIACFIFVLLLSSSSFAYDKIIEKKTFTLKELTLVSGKKIAPVKVGYETYGSLSPTGDNAILICHYFTGTSHAAGRYSAEEEIPGYWDKIIGPGKPFDTDKYFIISSDTLSNMNTKNPRVITTGPASVNPATGKPYGMTFPILTIRDFINVQYELVKSLGVKKLHAVAGASMGGFQTWTWAVSHPEFVERAIVVVSMPRATGWILGKLKTWRDPLISDPKWNNGDYFDKEEPTTGFANSMKIAIMDTFWAPWADQSFGREWADEKKNPYDEFDNQFMAWDMLDQMAAGAVNTADPNNFLYLVKAVSLVDIAHGFNSFEDALKSIKSKMLLIASSTDVLFYAKQVREYANMMKNMGKDATYFEIQSEYGHFGGILEIDKASDAIKSNLEKPVTAPKIIHPQFRPGPAHETH